MANSNRNSRTSLTPGVLLALGVLALAAPVHQAEAARGAAAGSRSGKMAQSSVSGANRSTYSNHASAGTANRANTGNVNTGNVNRGNVNTGNVNTGNVNRGNVNTGNINTGNVNVGNDVNINVDADYGRWGGGYYHPVATGVAIGAVAVTTAAIVGSYYYALPPSGCTVVVRNGVSYQQCGSVYYQQTWQGNDVVYVVVSP